MNEKDLFRAINGASDTQLLKSEKKPKRTLRWIAACAALIVLVCAPIVSRKGMFQDEAAAAIAALEFQGAFYEACDHPDVLTRYGLPRQITADMAGEHLAYLQSDGGAGYEETASVTDIELYTYAPSPCRAVYVLRDGKNYMAALFCNPYQFDTDTHMELGELFRIYGVESAQDIDSIAEIKFSGDLLDKVISPVIDDAEVIEDFYRISTSQMSYGNDGFQVLTFDGIPEDEQVDVHLAFADDNRTLRIETTDGLRFYIDVHPNFGWMDMALSYYKMDSQMSAWFSTYF